MPNALDISLKNLKWIKSRRRRISVTLLMLSLIVTLNVFWLLRQPGLTLAGDASCGIREHTHEEICYEAAEECLEEGHIHDENCPEQKLICGLEEHVHSIECYSDSTADVETMLDWQKMFADYPYTGNLAEDLVGIAKTQVGYSESVLNFEVGSDGIRRGYTRYGAWYGTPYRDWSAMFVSFCLNYAGANPEENPGNTGAFSMAELWNKLGKYALQGEYVPESGDLVFFDDNTVGIVAEVHNTTVDVIRGDIENAVCSELLMITDVSVIGWGLTEGNLQEPEEIPEEEPLEEIPEEPLEEQEQQNPPEETSQIGNEELFDISDGPAVFIFEGGEKIPQIQTYSRRMARSATELIPYLDANGGSYFFTLMDFNNVELPKDADGNYIAVAGTGYKITLTFSSPEGFVPGIYEYQIPNGLMVDGGEGNFVLKDGTNVGTWVVTDTGFITLDFNESINNHADITISFTLGIHFPEEDEPIDFDGLITVKVEPPEQQEAPTALSKWGSPNSAGGKINWTVRIDGHADSQIPGSILTDETALSDWSRPHSYTQSDIDNGISFGVSDPDGGWHSWKVTTDDPHLIWDENGWSYKIPKTVTCDYCGELELGNEGWIYIIDYSSTPTKLNTPGTFDYENKVTVDGQTAWGWSNFEHGEITAEIVKEGSFISDAGGGAFLWEFDVTIPGRVEGQRAEYSWFVMDEMKLMNENEIAIGRVQNDSNLSTVTANYNGTTIHVPRIQDATDQDMFAWDNAWTATENGISFNRTLNLLCRCQCTPETCHWSGCSEYWFQKDDGTWATNGFCQCWTETQNMTFTFIYKTTDLSMIEGYGTLGYKVNNLAQLYYMPDGSNSIRISYDDAIVKIPNLFEKQLTHDFDGYTAHYRVTVNEAKIVLTNGTPLHIHDVMTDTLTYISGSLVITAEDAEGNITTLKQGTDYTVEYDGTGGQTGEHGEEVHVLDIVIQHPQPVMYILDYDTTLIIPEHVTGAIKYSNSANITLWGDKVSDNATEKVYADINISTKSYKVELDKSSALTGEPLAGATFGLYNENGGLISTEKTDANGKLVFQTSIVEGIILRDHMLYYLQEIKAPPGYQLDDTKYWICFCDKTGDSCEICREIYEGADLTRVPFEQIGKVYATNQLMHYDLPATGGPGIYPLILVSVMFIITPLVYRFIQRRKQERGNTG